MSQRDKKKTLVFDATDTLFFRESRPMDATGELSSVFPPSVRTLIGATRHWIATYGIATYGIGTDKPVDWHAFKQDDHHPLRALIGSPQDENDLGQLHFQGAWLSHNGQRLYPVPLNLLRKTAGGRLYQLVLSEQGYHCDLGNKVRLAEYPQDTAQGSKPLNNTWMSKTALQRLLRGETLAYTQNDFFSAEQLFARESRIGIAIDHSDHKRGTVKEGMLYQTQHIRPKAATTIEIDIMGLNTDDYPQNTLMRLGGEGRSVNMHVQEHASILSHIIPSKKVMRQCQGIILYLLTPLLLPDNTYNNASHSRQTETWQALPDFNICEKNQAITYWQGEINGITLKLYGAIVGKALREGGWDLARQRPRPVKSLLPAGSLFYCEVIGSDISTAINTLHNAQIGQLTHYGYGQLAVGLWK